MIRIQFEMKGKEKTYWVTLDNPEYFISVGHAQAFLKDPKNKYLLNLNARIVDEKIKILVE